MTETATVPKEVRLVVAALDDKRAKDIVVLDLTKVSDSLDYFVLATAESTLQLRALQESVKERLKRSGAQPCGIEGPSERWVLIDYGSVVVHLMSPEAREFYDLEVSGSTRSTSKSCPANLGACAPRGCLRSSVLPDHSPIARAH